MRILRSNGKSMTCLAFSSSAEKAHRPKQAMALESCQDVTPSMYARLTSESSDDPTRLI